MACLGKTLFARILEKPLFPGDVAAAESIQNKEDELSDNYCRGRGKLYKGFRCLLPSNRAFLPMISPNRFNVILKSSELSATMSLELRGKNQQNLARRGDFSFRT